jgi:hypothetical protein
VSGRVLLSAREHLQNRAVRTDVSRVFVGRNGRAWVTGDAREAMDPAVAARLTDLLDGEIRRRLNVTGPVIVDPAILGVALPLSGKGSPGGMGVLPRGSVSPVEGNLLRFFAYWRERAKPTDYDLSVLMLDATYGNPAQVSWTNYHADGYATHSGDLTSAPDGATEFIDVRLPAVDRRFIIAQLNIFSGEAFGEAQEAFFGFMLRDQQQEGQPFEPRTVRMKSDLQGTGRVALPVAFMRGDDGTWRAKWLHLYLNGEPAFNQVEANTLSTSLLLRGIVERDYLRVGYLVDQLKAAGVSVSPLSGGLPAGPVTFIGMERPERLPAGSVAYTPRDLHLLIPA